MIDRNDWFQRQVLASLERSFCTPRVLFSYSYAALDLFRAAKSAGWTTVLGQIDPGPFEERLVLELQAANPKCKESCEPAPAKYWARWREECELADSILVNSDWSAHALQEEGIPAHKIQIVPLVYDPPTEAGGFVRDYPSAFTPQRPMRVLFLGQVILRKGIAAVLEAMRHLSGEPIEFVVAGPIYIQIPEQLRRSPCIRWLGPVPRSQAAAHYRWADVFLFPTHSDGFGLTQLEAQAWRLPIVTSHFCGRVVEDGRNGIVLQEVSGGTVVDALANCLRSPDFLRTMSMNSEVGRGFSTVRLSESLAQCEARSKNC